MNGDASDSFTGFPLGASRSASARSCRFEDEVVSLFDRLRAPVFRYLLSFGISVPDAEEIVQEVFLSLFDHLRQGKPRQNPEGWIFKVAHNLALRYRQRGRKHADRFTSEPSLCDGAADGEPDPEEFVASRQRQDRLLAVVRALPEQDRCCLSLRAEGLRYRQIAAVLGISLGSVAASLERSLARLTRAEQR